MISLWGARSTAVGPHEQGAIPRSDRGRHGAMNEIGASARNRTFEISSGSFRSMLAISRLLVERVDAGANMFLKVFVSQECWCSLLRNVYMEFCD